MKKIVFMLGVSMLSLSTFASNNDAEKQSIRSGKLEFEFNEQSVTETSTDYEYKQVVGVRYDKSRKEFVPFDVNKYFGEFTLSIVRDSHGNMYYKDGNMKEYKIVQNRYTTYGGMSVSGYRYMCDTFWTLLLFNFK